MVWGLWFRDNPADMSNILPAELAELAPAATQRPVPWRRLFTSRQLWLITIAYFCYAWGCWFYFCWFTTWLVRGAGFSIRQMGVVAALPFVLGLLGNLAGGVLSERLVERYGRRNAYRAVAAICLVTTASLLAGMSVTPNKMKIAVLASLGLDVMDLMLPSAWAMCMSLGGEFRETATAVMNTAGNLGG